jgi:DNA repair protein RecO (recombination protein O)
VSQEKTHALVIRLVDWSESSRVVTLFTRDFGKIGVIAKGAKRLRSAFEAGLDLLSECRIVFLRKSSSGLDILTESQLISRFSPAAGSLSSLYGGYYVAELLTGLTEEYDPHPALYDVCVETLARLSSDADPRLALARFELVLLRELGQLPEFDACLVCDRPLTESMNFSYWVGQGGLICAACRKPEYAHKPIQLGTINLLKQLAATELAPCDPTPDQLRQLRQMTVSAVCHSLERRPATLRYLNLD